MVSLEGVAPTQKKSVPIIALPTTAGTAAEVTINYVITDEVNEKKMVCVDPNDIPAIAIVDAELMYTLPKGLTASTGLDALTHAIEGLITKGAWEMSDMFEIKAIEMITRYLETAVFEPTNAEARNGMAVAQYIAGMAFSNVGLGVVHGMAHPLGAIFDIPHGVANALLLPIIMEFNAPAALDKYVEIAKAMTVYKEGMSQEEAARAAVDAVRALSVRVGIPQQLLLNESALSLIYVKKECPSAYISAVKSPYSLSSTSPSLVSKAIVSTGKVRTALVRSLLNHFMKRFCNQLNDSQWGAFPSGKTKCSKRLLK